MFSLSSAIERQGRGLFRRFLIISCLGSLLTAGGAEGKLVDAELLLLVDVSGAVSDQEFGALLDGFAQSFESAALIDGLQGEGKFGIAASLVFFGQPGTEAVAVPWTLIRTDSHANAFAAAIRNAERPTPSVFTSVSSGLDFATPQFGSETGFAANGFNSYWQGISVTTETSILLGDWPAAVAAARDAALGAGVEVINGITVGGDEFSAAANYYETNILGGWGADHSPGAVVNAPSYADLPAVATSSLTAQILSLIPEPSTPLLVLVAVGGLALRRSRAIRGMD